MQNFDLVVLGGGPAGYLAAERAGHAGLKVAVCEKRALGGVCLNEGCIPSKTLLNSAKIYEYASHGDKYGVTTTGAAIDQNFVINRKNKVVKVLVAGVGMKMKKNGVSVFTDSAKIDGKTPDGIKIICGEQELLAKNLIIATGSDAIVPGIPGVKEAYQSGLAMTNREILDLKEIPENLVIIGGGVIGLEMASYFNSVGASVTVIEMLNSIGGPQDKDIAEILLNNYKKKGVNFKLGCKVTEVKGNEVFFEGVEGTSSIKADKILLSIGRRPNISDIGIEEIGIFTEKGAIKTDDKMKTNVPNVFACGDVNGIYMLAHAAYREAEVAVNNILGKKDTMRYNAIPAVIYTNPEVASVGETEETAKQKGFEIKTVTIPMRYSGRYLAEVDGGDGICKLVVNKKLNTLLGVHLIGSYASEIIYGAAMMIENETKIENLKEIVFPHPSVSEIIREALFEI